jgi:hypothetical protein
MGCEVSYCSTRPVTPEEAEAIDESASRLCENPDWVRCEPIIFVSCIDGHTGGPLSGSSKLSFKPFEELASPDLEMYDATIHDLLNALCELSREHKVDWEISHEYSDGPVGYIRTGVADDKLVAEIDRLAAEIESVRRSRRYRNNQLD